jgi:two-component system nitrogen regulation response regulator NtrX
MRRRRAAPRLNRGTMTTILVVDDDPRIQDALRRLFDLEGFRMLSAGSGEEALDLLAREEADAVLLDVVLPGMDGLETLAALRSREGAPPVVMISAQGTIETAVRAVREGAHDFLEKPLGADRLLIVLRNALETSRLAAENRVLRTRLDGPSGLLGESRAMRGAREAIAKVAPTHSRVLVTGESGTGKELAARALHEGSPRASGPFVTLNCAAVPSELIESELFGHERGAFSGAVKTRRGKFEAADKGTLFLDEIGDMPLPMQAKLLRALESGEVERVGGAGPVRVDVRVVAATNRDLEADVKTGRFRLDLFHRLNVFPVVLPPLREHPEDLPLLVEHLLARLSEEHGRQAPRLAPDAIEALRAHPWPGNVRELRNLLERLFILHGSETITGPMVRASLPLPAPRAETIEPVPEGRTLRVAMDDLERRLLLATLRAEGWNVTHTAERLGMERSHLYKKMKEYGIGREE